MAACVSWSEKTKQSKIKQKVTKKKLVPSAPLGGSNDQLRRAKKPTASLLSPSYEVIYRQIKVYKLHSSAWSQRASEGR